MRKQHRIRVRAGVLAGVTATALVAAGCTSGQDDLAEPSFAPATDAATENATENAAGLGDGVEEVDPATFDLRGSTVFDYRTGDDGTGICLIAGDTDGADATVTCTGNTPDDAPDIEIPPFDQQRPGSVTISDEGYHYTTVEGVPPAPAALEPGQRVTMDSASCQMEQDSELNCTVGDTSLTVSGDDREMTLTGELLDHENHVDGADGAEADDGDDVLRGRGGDYSETDEPVSAGTMCGAASGNTLVQVREGSVSCLEAQEVIDDYRDRRTSEGGGNTLAMAVGDWDCSTPSAMRSQELDAAETCSGPDGEVIATPAGS